MPDGLALFERLRAALRSRPPTSCGREPHGLKAASVLIPLFWRGGEPWALLTMRPLTLRTHPGQISFPGGRRDPGDLTPLHTALRETHEELGIEREAVDVLGMLEALPTVTAYHVTPFVGAIPAALRLTPNAEVANVLEAPLWRLRRERRVLLRAEREAFVWDDGQHVVWGATWRILSQLLVYLDGPPS